jgi:hypothetical protein
VRRTALLGNNSPAAGVNLACQALINRSRHATDQLAPAFRRASLDRHGYSVDCQRVMSGSDLVDAVWFTTRVDQWTGDFVTQSGDRFSPDIVVGRAADNCAAVVGQVADCNDFQ